MIRRGKGKETMASNSKQTKSIRMRKLARSGKKRKRMLRRLGSTPSLKELLKDKPSEAKS